MSGATITARGITILLFDWKRFFFPMDDQSKTGKIFFTVSCIELSNESHGLVGGMTLKYELNECRSSCNFHRTWSSHFEHFTKRKRCLQRNWQSTLSKISNLCLIGLIDASKLNYIPQIFQSFAGLMPRHLKWQPCGKYLAVITLRRLGCWARSFAACTDVTLLHSTHYTTLRKVPLPWCCFLSRNMLRTAFSWVSTFPVMHLKTVLLDEEDLANAW